MFALVTGGTGFIGSNLVDKLLKDGWQVRILSRKPGNQKRIDWIIGDISDEKVVKTAISGIDVIFNLAAALPYHRLPEEHYFDANVKGVENILKACRQKKIKRLVHVSTVGIYGPTGDDVFSESSKLRLTDIYSKTKAEGEKLIRNYYKKYKLPAVIIKPTIGYGPYDTRPGFLNLFKLLEKGLFILIGNGENFFHTVYVGNLVDALILASTKKEAIGKDFIIGDEPCPKMADILEKMAKIVGVKLHPFYLPLSLARFLASIGDIMLILGLKPPLSTQRFRFLTENKRYSIEKAKKILKYKPKVDLDEGLVKTYLWYRKNGYI